MADLSGSGDFAALAPDAVMDGVERATGRRASGVCRPLASYVNRVFEIGLEDGGFLVAKFYRPGRWTRAALQDEHDFLRELAAAEIPVVAPLADAAGQTLHAENGIFFATFPRLGGRPCDEPTRDEWLQIGRLIGRIHQIGAARPAAHRLVLGPQDSARTHLAFLRESGVLPGEVAGRYLDAAQRLLDRIAPLFADVARQRLHGYETFAEYDDAQTRLIEPLRALRYLHYAAWCARQRADEGRRLLHPEWGTADFWRRELADLQRQAETIEAGL